MPIDFSEMSIQAIDVAKHIARRFEARVHLVHVNEAMYPAGFMTTHAPELMGRAVSILQHTKNLLRQRLTAIASKHEWRPEDCHMVSASPTFTAICELARTIPADLIVMPTRGHTGLKHVLLGSTAERVVQHSPVPVFVARKTGRTIDKILVPVDFSGSSLEALTYAIQVADTFDAKIVVLHAVNLGYADTRDGYAMYNLSALTTAARNDAERQMRDFIAAAKFGRVKRETAIRVGPPVQEICAFAEGEDVGLIVTATHGRTGFMHLLIGSVAEQVVRHAGCGVLVVPSNAKTRLANLTRPLARREITCGVRRHERIDRKHTSRIIKKRGSAKAHALPERRKTNKFRETRSSK